MGNNNSIISVSEVRKNEVTFSNQIDNEELLDSLKIKCLKCLTMNYFKDEICTFCEANLNDKYDAPKITCSNCDTINDLDFDQPNCVSCNLDLFLIQHNKLEENYYLYQKLLNNDHITMPYINCKIRGKDVVALIDSGAGKSIISKKLVDICGLYDIFDSEYSGKVIGMGVGERNIIGKIWACDLNIDDNIFYSSLIVLEDIGDWSRDNDKEINLVIGLDFLNRNNCIIDFKNKKIDFNNFSVYFI